MEAGKRRLLVAFNRPSSTNDPSFGLTQTHCALI